jgi:hypothetical protein
VPSHLAAQMLLPLQKLTKLLLSTSSAPAMQATVRGNALVVIRDVLLDQTRDLSAAPAVSFQLHKAAGVYGSTRSRLPTLLCSKLTSPIHHATHVVKGRAQQALQQQKQVAIEGSQPEQLPVLPKVWSPLLMPAAS